MMRRTALVGVLLVASLALVGCTEAGPDGADGLTGVIDEWKKPTTAPVDFSGPTISGSTFSSKDHLGQVVVVNFWYAQCPPCRAEAPDLKAVAAKYAKDDVQFVGVNTIDTKDTAEGFIRDFSVVYPNILDQANGAGVQLAFAGTTPPKAVPSTLVLDRKGRVVARIVGAINASVLRTFVDDALDGTAT